MGQKKRRLLSTLAAQMTAMISMSLVLIVLGLMSLGGIAAHSLTEQVRQRMGFTVIMDDNATADQINTLLRSWRTASYVSAVKYTSPAQALERWKTSTGDDEDIVTLLGTNPFRPEIDVNVTSHYANVDSLRPIIAAVAAMPGVGEVRLQARMIDNINKAVNKAAIVGGIIAAALLFISIVLINNLVRLSIYARRFIIHTMKLVGATPAFIRRPFVFASAFNGLLSGFIAVAVIGSLLAYGYATGQELALLMPVDMVAWILGGVIVLGVVLCTISAFIATNHYLRIDYDNLHK
ncbi:MAG: hypothetical protein C7K11_07060 [Candidatus Amulumruptor caecigallinarius]|uniref:Cell division protein FtsX n=1 Tax=Candidatus Amulumruptor caecigallinarius TaxID=2109911 RepID=A0A4Q0U7Z6_9BACT|nr:MAG: hypothetical protein C7K11_07060 [Candidatus Amulumruptor caecigallinarius]HJE39655.1 permease-like cell division protein FtsX [Candidatus Amulumruptor caecigallinarius]